MDVKDSNLRDRGPKNKLKTMVPNGRISHFSVETYFIWFSVLIYTTELIVDLCLATYYLHKNQLEWGFTTLGIILISMIVCQFYSMCLLRADNTIDAKAILFHIFLMGVQFRYHSILRKIDKEKSATNSHEIASIKQGIRDVNAIQTLNAILQYCPQSLFQVFIIVYRKYKCVVTGVSAGLAGFAFFWHVFLHFYFWLDRNDEKLHNRHNVGSNARIIDNLSTTPTEPSSIIIRTTNSGASSIISNSIDNRNHNQQSSNDGIASNFKNFEKSTYSSHDKNLVTKKNAMKNFEKSKIFGLNKRKPIYEKEDFELCETSNISTVFFELDSSVDSKNRSLFSINKENDNFINENNLNTVKTFKDMNHNANMKKVNCDFDDDPKHPGSTKKINGIQDNRNSLLKRKGICSSQEMLHLVDVLNDTISAEQVDKLAKSLVEIGGDESLRTESEHEDPDYLKLLENFPPIIDDKLLENIDAAIYENQIIFQERIRKNQLTIQNLKLQDQLLSKYMTDGKMPCNEILSVRDYENMCFTNISRQNRCIKHWRNYLTDIHTNNHDNSTVQHSSFYVNTNTLSNSLTDLYINEINFDSFNNDNNSVAKNQLSDTGRSVQWPETNQRLAIGNEFNCCDDETSDLYVNMMTNSGNGVSDHDGACALPEKNILVETINKINVDSPLKNLLVNQPESFPIN